MPFMAFIPGYNFIFVILYFQTWKTQQWPQDWKRSVFIPAPKKGNAKEYSNYHTVALISHASKACLVARLVKNLPAMQETWFQSLG